jgi:CRISPR/Cas system-associated exonuclease Cas4 (RecB family)
MTPKLQTQSLAELRAVPHISVSQLKAFLMCPRRYFLQYIEGVAPAFKPAPLPFGTAWHEAIGFYLTTSTKTEQADRDEVKAIFRERFSMAVEGDRVPVLFDEGEDVDKSIDTAMKMLDVFMNKFELPEKVVGVELPFSLELVDPEFGDTLQTPLIGALDALVMNNGRPAVVEFKSASRRWSADQLAFDLQMTGYQMAAEHLGYADPELVMVITTKTTKPDVQLERVVRTKADRDDLIVTAQSVSAAIMAGVDHPVRGWGCKGCPYAYACR